MQQLLFIFCKIIISNSHIKYDLLLKISYINFNIYITQLEFKRQMKTEVFYMAGSSFFYKIFITVENMFGMMRMN